MIDPGYPGVDAGSIGWIDEAEMVEVDRVMIEDLHIELVQMMENAGRNLARLVLDGWRPGRVAVAAGSGGNGGGGLVAARHLANAGVDVVVTTTRSPSELTGVPAHQLDIVQRMGVPVTDVVADDADVVVDALIGYSLRGGPTGRTGDLVESIAGRPNVVALDTPSGLDVSTGATPGVVVTAAATMTLALPKAGLRRSPHVGELYLADISVPPAVTGALGPAAPHFDASSILRLTGRG